MAKKVISIISKPEHTITVDLGIGNKSDFCYGCDLSMICVFFRIYVGVHFIYMWA